MVAPLEMPKESVLRLMKTNQINALPIVDENRTIVGLHLLNELIAPALRDNLMVIMAGGQGMRLRPFTENCPKPLLPVKRRATLVQKGVDEIAESILEHGLQAPILVRRDGERFVEGLHRLEACRNLGEHSILCYLVQACRH